MMTRRRIGALVLAGCTALGMTTVIALAHPAVEARSSLAIAPERVTMVIVPDAMLGSNKKTHDAFVPASMSVTAGRQVVVTVYNLDTAPHTFTAPGLKLNVVIPGAKAAGLVGVTTFTFTATKAGTYHWKCILPCDNGGLNAWAMTHDGFMAGTVTVTRG